MELTTEVRYVDQGIFLVMVGVIVLFAIGFALLVTAIVGGEMGLFWFSARRRWGPPEDSDIVHPPEQHPLRTGVIGLGLMVIAVLIGIALSG